jgi:hypothetical protein
MSVARIRSRQPTVTIRLGGGLGNQLFQYAFGRRLSMANRALLYLDASGYEDVTQPDSAAGLRMLGLDHFNIAGTLLRRRSDIRPPEPWIRRKIRKYWDKFARLVEQTKPYYLKQVVVEPERNHFKFDPRLYNRAISGNVSLYGYWQTEKYFAEVEPIIRHELVVRDPLDEANARVAKAIESTNSISIHVRHGDNAGSIATALGVLPSEYFLKAISNLLNCVAQPHFFVFSDDIPWAKELLILAHPTTFVTHNGDARNYEDLRLMSFCKHHIVGNSTFSWWGAWLGKKDGQIVYAPRRYYQNIDRPNPDLYPERWQLI